MMLFSNSLADAFRSLTTPPLSSTEAPSVEKRRKKKGKGRKTGEIKNRGRAGGDGKGEKAGASAR